jgi:DNA-directed RNA polymerase subunit beta
MNKLFVNNVGDLAEAQRSSFYRFLSLGISEEMLLFPNPFFAKVRIRERTRRIYALIYLYSNSIKLKGPNSNLDVCIKRHISYTIQIFIPAEYSYPSDSNYHTLKLNLKANESEDSSYTYIDDEEVEEKDDQFILNQQDFFQEEREEREEGEEGEEEEEGEEGEEEKFNDSNFEKEYDIERQKREKEEQTHQYLVTKFTKKDRIKQTRIKQDIFFGEIPLMTEEGTFLINGCERVVISQIIRSPGIYFRKEFGIASSKANYSATIISNKGLWTKFVLEKYKKEKDQKKLTDEEKILEERLEDKIYIKLNNFKASKDENSEHHLYIYELIKYFGLNLQEISDNLKYGKHLAIQQLSPLESKKEKIFERNSNTANLIKSLFLNQRSGCFSIGEIGRYKINKKLGLNLPKDITYLTVQDFLGILDGLIELKYYERINDDIDDIKNKLIRSIGELLQLQMRAGFYRLQKSFVDEHFRAAYIYNNRQKFNFDFEMFEDYEDWIIDPRPLTNSMKEFFKTSQLSQYMDQINPLSELTHKRRISVFGPNGLKRDHISTVIRDIHPSQYGKLCPIETPEGQNAGLIMAIAMHGRINSLGSIETPYFFIEKGTILNKKHPIFLNPEQEAQTKIGFSDISLPINNEKYISTKENCVFSVKKIKTLNFITVSPSQIISLATGLIPFLEHDDANRALMGSNMQRQAVPLLYPQKPIVGTGSESVSILDSGMVIKNYCEGFVKFSSSYSIHIIDKKNQEIIYYLKKYRRSNQETSINQRPIVWKNEKVFSGQVIADGPSTCDGELSLGRNLIIGYMPWEGYNYEDAIVINENILLDDCLTSVHIEEYEMNLDYCPIGNEKLTRKLPQTTYIRRHLNKDGIVKLGSYIKEHDTLIGKLTPCQQEPTPENKLYKALYGVNKKNFKDTSLRVSAGSEGRVIDIRIVSTILDPGLNKSSIIIRIFVAQTRKLQVGDKLSGRHGNKGIVARILPSQDMPYLPDGTPLDIIFNPLGVPSRMNVGQVFECLLGFAGQKLGNRFKVFPFDEIFGKEASRILINQKLKEASLKKDLNWIFDSSYPGKILLRDGRTGEFFDNPITVGKSYILKLIHLVEDKIHARATGPYAMITEQPLAGKSQKGGQRFGEMEVWALEAYGCSNTLQELLTIKSDDIDGRNDMYESILMRKEIEKPIPFLPEAFLALMRELNALGLDFSMNKITDRKNEEKDIFKELEERLKLRALLVRYKAEYFSKSKEYLIDKTS